MPRRGGNNSSKIPALGKPKTGNEGAKPSNGGEAGAENTVTAHEGFEKIMCKLASMDTSISGLTLEIREGISLVNFKVEELSEKVNSETVKSGETKEKVLELGDVTAALKTRASVQGARLADVERKIEQLERDKRKNVIIIEGVTEDENNPSPEVIELLFRDLKVDYDTLVCDRIYRRGKDPRGTGDKQKPEVEENDNKRGPRRPRPIVVGFRSLTDKIELFKHLKNLQGVAKWEHVYINDDLTECQQRQLRDLRSLSAFARSLGHRSSVRSSSILVNDSKYAYGDIHRLAPELTLEKAKTLVCLQGTGIAFQSEHAPLSNLYPCNIVYKSRAFLSAEGALQYTRAVFCRRAAEASAIECERNAYEVKRISSTFRHSPEWDLIVVDTLIEILLIKFTTDAYCKNALMATGERRLFEATGDKTWACGLPLSKIHELKLPIPGRNRTGEVLEKVREIIRKK